MPVIGPWEKKKILIVVKTYPTPAKRGVEVSCTAGVTEDGQWIRLFPIPYRLLGSGKHFAKYQWIEAEVAKSSDPRPESHEINVDSLKVLPDSLDGWGARKNLLEPLKAHCLCCLREARARDKHPTLGFFKPKKIRRFVIRKDAPEWSESDLAKLTQKSMFGKAPKRILEKIPYKFIYQVFCDERDCRGHHLSCTDWELCEAYRKWKDRYPDDWEDKLREGFEHKMMRNDTHLFVGTVSKHPASWIIVGLFYPPMKERETPARGRRRKNSASQLQLPF